MVGTTPRRPPIFAMLADCFPSFCPASGRRGYLVLVTLCPRRLPAGGPVGCVPWTFLPCCTSPVPRFRPFSLLSSTLAAPRRAPHLTRFALSSVSRCLLVSLSRLALVLVLYSSGIRDLICVLELLEAGQEEEEEEETRSKRK